jgi:hypothetical protein
MEWKWTLLKYFPVKTRSTNKNLFLRAIAALWHIKHGNTSVQVLFCFFLLLIANKTDVTRQFKFTQTVTGQRVVIRPIGRGRGSKNEMLHDLPETRFETMTSKILIPREGAVNLLAGGDCSQLGPLRGDFSQARKASEIQNIHPQVHSATHSAPTNSTVRTTLPT